MRSLVYQPIFLALTLVLGACTTGQGAVVQLGIEKIKTVNDNAAQVMIQSTCAMTVGAYNRLQKPTDKRGVHLLCGGNGDDPITLESLRRFIEAQ